MSIELTTYPGYRFPTEVIHPALSYVTMPTNSFQLAVANLPSHPSVRAAVDCAARQRPGSRSQAAEAMSETREAPAMTITGGTEAKSIA